jgi:hypothetical protein
MKSDCPGFVIIALALSTLDESYPAHFIDEKSKVPAAPWRSGRSPHWVKVKNPKAPVVTLTREAEEDWADNLTDAVRRTNDNSWDEKLRLRDRYHSESSHYAENSKAAGAWAIPAALPSSPTRMPSFRDGIRWVSKLKTPAKEFPAPISESYLLNSAILLGASRTGGWLLSGFNRVSDSTPDEFSYDLTQPLVFFAEFFKFVLWLGLALHTSSRSA